MTVGNFDGVHLGHQAMLRDVGGQGARGGGAVRRRDVRPAPAQGPAPRARPEDDPDAAPARGGDRGLRDRRARPRAVHARLLAHARPRSSRGSSSGGRLAAREVCVGAHFVFGRERGGNLDLLRRVGVEAGFSVRGPRRRRGRGRADLVDAHPRPRSPRATSPARTRCSGRPYAMDGIIAKGDRMGRKIGFPTMNLQPGQRALPEGRRVLHEREARVVRAHVRVRHEHRAPSRRSTRTTRRRSSRTSSTSRPTSTASACDSRSSSASARR